MSHKRHLRYFSTAFSNKLVWNDDVLTEEISFLLQELPPFISHPTFLFGGQRGIANFRAFLKGSGVQRGIEKSASFLFYLSFSPCLQLVLLMLLLLSPSHLFKVSMVIRLRGSKYSPPKDEVSTKGASDFSSTHGHNYHSSRFIGAMVHSTFFT